MVQPMPVVVQQKVFCAFRLKKPSGPPKLLFSRGKNLDHPAKTIHMFHSVWLNKTLQKDAEKVSVLLVGCIQNSFKKPKDGCSSIRIPGFALPG